jgi:hypothetical protein
MARTVLGFRFRDDDATDDIVSEAENIALQPGDQARAVARPDTIDRFYYEDEYRAKARGQRKRWLAAGLRAARSHFVKASGLSARVAVLLGLIAAATVRRDDAQAALKNITDDLRDYVYRGPLAKRFYLLTWILLLGGDVAGVSGAAIMFGEIPVLAVLQALAAGVAAVTAGLIGQDLRDYALAQRRKTDPATLTPAQQRHPHLFTGGNIIGTTVKAMVYVALTIALLLIGGIWALRAGAQDELAGIVYGAFAGAICLASAINTYVYRDEVADRIDKAQLDLAQAEKHLEKLSQSPELVTYGEETAAVASIEAEYELESEGAEHEMAALMHGVSRRHPDIAGHGMAAAVPSTPIPELPDLVMPDLHKPHSNSDGR